MIELCSRRDALSVMGAGLASTLLLPQIVRAGFMHLSYRFHGTGWDDYGRRKVVAAAMDLVGNMSENAVVTRAYNKSGRAYYLSGGTWDRTNPNSHYRGLGYQDVLWVQLSNLSASRPRPMVNIHPYYSTDFSWGKAPLDTVTVKITPGSFSIDGEFKIYLNFHKLGGGGLHSSPAAWAGLIAHEMLHNLGHMHGVGDYRPTLQINALQQAVFEAGRGSERIVAARHFRCGGRP